MSASPPADDFPIDGAPFPFLREFIDANGGEAAFEGLTTDDVKEERLQRFHSQQTAACVKALKTHGEEENNGGGGGGGGAKNQKGWGAKTKSKTI